MNSPHMRNVFVKIKVPTEKTRAFAAAYERNDLTTRLEDDLCGYSQEGDKHTMIVSVSMDSNAVTSLLQLNALITSLVDYYASLSEQPSETQKVKADEFRAALPALTTRTVKTASLAHA